MTLLGPILLLLVFGTIQGGTPSAQSDLIAESRGRLLDAFLGVRDAERGGAQPADIAQLVSGLNMALDLQLVANSTGSLSNATLSIAESSLVSGSAANLRVEASAREIRISILAYALAFWAAAVSSLLVVEAHRLPSMLRRNSRRRTRPIARP